MSLFSQISSLFLKPTIKISKCTQKLPNRFLQGGFMPMGAVTNKPRVNTTAQLMASINAYAKENPEIAEFAKQMKDMNPEHLRLAHDIIDLSRIEEMLPTNIDLNKPVNSKNSIAGFILQRLPEVSRQNPAALDLTETVINNSDTQNAKYFLYKLFGFDLTKMSGLSEQFKAVKDIVPLIAKTTLNGMYTMDYVKNAKFFETIQHFCQLDTKPQNIKFINKIYEIMQSIPRHNLEYPGYIDVDVIRTGNTAKIEENIPVLKKVLHMAAKENKSIDISAFLTQNTNLT